LAAKGSDLPGILSTILGNHHLNETPSARFDFVEYGKSRSQWGLGND
jgi:hypothetical protein